jgi:hypothetical protein
MADTVTDLHDIDADLAEVNRRLAELEKEFDDLYRRHANLLHMLEVLRERRAALIAGRLPPNLVGGAFELSNRLDNLTSGN